MHILAYPHPLACYLPHEHFQLSLIILFFHWVFLLFVSNHIVPQLNQYHFIKQSITSLFFTTAYQTTLACTFIGPPPLPFHTTFAFILWTSSSRKPVRDTFVPTTCLVCCSARFTILVTMTPLCSSFLCFLASFHKRPLPTCTIFRCCFLEPFPYLLYSAQPR